ncbi:VOC family protein [Croceibacterium ferulae]|uniref:VOC family protein n=1 Tax=Croceibacterium ferulae TaxID=1854641 RepID=UPI000EB01212|nr:VOC family protein [Croceibacterium ferulae]
MDIINHIELAMADVEASRRFYEAALEPLGLSLVIGIDAAQTGRGTPRYGFGRDGYPGLWMHGAAGDRLPIHVAFTAADRKAVDAFHAAALAADGRDNGGPGIRQRYHPAYYAAYVFDPDGNNIEAVCQTL